MSRMVVSLTYRNEDGEFQNTELKMETGQVAFLLAARSEFEINGAPFIHKEHFLQLDTINGELELTLLPERVRVPA